jgi:flagellar biosynthesis protein FlhG
LVAYAHLTPAVRERFQRLMQQLRPLYDVVLLDTGAGLADVVLFALHQADEVLLVTTPEPTALTDAYAMLKVLATEQGRRKARVLVNQVTETGQGAGIVRQLQSVLSRFVAEAPMQLVLAGELPLDPAVKAAVMRRRLLLAHQPEVPAALAMQALADGLLATVLARD